MDAPRPTSELAADVRAAYDPEAKDSTILYANSSLDALVARITDLEAQVAALGARYADLSALYDGIQANGDEYGTPKPRYGRRRETP